MTVDDKNQAALFRRMIEQLWGWGAQAQASRHFEVSDRTVRNWLSGKHSIPAGVMAELRAMVAIAPPPGSTSDEDRDEACARAIEPALTELRDRAVAVGWHPAEVAASIMSLTVDEIRQHAGEDQAREVLVQALGCVLR
jgi:hypothetical protein